MLKFLLIGIVVILIGAILIIVLNFVGWRFVIPTKDQKLIITESVLQSLQTLRQKSKYNEDPDTLYNGIIVKEERWLAEKQLNKLIDRLRNGLPLNGSKNFVLREFKITMAQFEPVDTEDRERFLSYLEEIMDIVGIESSDGLFQSWMYGWISGYLVDKYYIQDRE